MTPTWLDSAPILDPSWTLFGLFLRVVLASSFKIAFKTAFGRYLNDLRPRASLIYSRILEEIEDARICLSVALDIDLGPILAPFCTPKPVQRW